MLNSNKPEMLWLCKHTGPSAVANLHKKTNQTKTKKTQTQKNPTTKPTNQPNTTTAPPTTLLSDFMNFSGPLILPAQVNGTKT